ncbi:MAG: threonine--tRNA ligase [Deltaproteobacteria bacterium]|nr:threonine--tRNA ligase [Deltaproteobacteria bacterium]
MKSFAITLPDGSKRTFGTQTTPQQVAASIGRRLEEAAVAAKLNGKEIDLTQVIDSDAELAIITRESKEGLEVIRHSTAHLLAQAIKELYPSAQITIGPVIEEGFYYDIDCPKQLTPEDLPAIEKKMSEIAGRKLDVSRHEIDRNEAVKLFKAMNEHYKAEIVEGLPSDEVVSAYKQGDFIDLCRGPHVPNTSRLGKFKLLSVAGAYWRGNEKNKMLQRIYGTAFASQKELDEYLHRLEEAKRRDHRKLGPELELFTFLPIAPAMPFYLPKGAWLFNKLIDFMREETKSLGFEEVICPQMMSTELWVTSGHMEHYRENMFLFEEEEGQAMGLKPMNCPGHASLFKTSKRSYRELPIRFSEYTKLHRNERGGVTHGIMRTRAFSQDDGHIFCTEEQIQEEARKGIEHTFSIYSAFGFNHIDVKLATRPDQFLGSPELWDQAEKALADSLKAAGKNFEIVPKEGAFYGPKIEFHIKDAIGRSWQCGTIQLDFSLPRRFQLEYTDSNNQSKSPVMIHRAILGSVERFMGILVEHHAGHLPIWIAPVQAVLINVTDGQLEYAQTILETLKGLGIRAELDARNEKLGYKIREAQVKKIPLMLVLGEKEKTAQTLSVRKSNGETINDLTLDGFRKFLEPWLKPGGTNH